MQPKSHYVQINDLRLHYLDWGNSGNNPLICLHGLNANAGLWDSFCSQVRKHYHVIALDQRGHGESQWDPDGYTIEKYVSDILAFKKYLGETPVTIVGYSLGGIVAMRCAALYPDQIDRLVVVDMSPAPGKHVTKKMLEEEDTPTEFESLDAAVNWASKSYLWARGDGLRADLAKRIRQQKDGRWIWKADPNIWGPNFSENIAKHTEEYWHSFRKIQCPIMIVRGLNSDILTETIKQKILSLQPDCTWVDIQGAGHNIPIDQPKAFLKAVCPFLGIELDENS